MTPLSVVIITFNEEKNIARCLDSVKEVADEIVVVDSYSTDGTEKICLSYEVRFTQNKFEGHIEQKNFALQQASNDYVLSLDADECLSPELKNSVREAKQNLSYDAYQMNRLNNYCGKWIRHGGWYPDRKIRLWNRKKGIWGGINPHDRVVMQESASIGFLEGSLLHYAYTTINEHRAKNEKYSSIIANAMFKEGRKVKAWTIFPRAVFTFVKFYFLKLGFLDGYYGFTISRLAAQYTQKKYSKLVAVWRNQAIEN